METVSQQIRDFKVAIYRQDFNAYPAHYWQTGETETQHGLNELRYINGVYSFLDGLRERFPKLIIDNCASGGRRLDIEMAKRSVALWRSDSCWGTDTFPRNVQAMAHGLSLWWPLHGLGATGTDAVSLRSGMGACASFAINYRDPNAVTQLNAHLQRYLPAREDFIGDYYPLTEWSLDPQRWLAWQFHNADRETGIVQAFCGQATSLMLSVRLRGLKPDGIYQMVDWDNDSTPKELTGKELMQKAWLVNSEGQRPTAKVWTYRRIR